MSIEDAISGALAAQLAPLREEIRRLAAEVEEMRRDLGLSVDLGLSQDLAESTERMWCDDLDDLEESADPGEPPAAPLPSTKRNATS